MTEIPVPPGADPGVAAFFARLRALQIGVEEGWFDLLAGDNDPGRYLVELPDGVRELGPDGFWWVLGVADGYGFGHLVLEPPEVPDLLTIEDAADLLGLSVPGVRYRLSHQPDLMSVYPGGRRHRLVEVQVRAMAGDEAAEREWARLRSLWPQVPAVDSLDPPPVIVQPSGPSHRLPAAERRYLALTALSAAGLLRYLWFDAASDVYAAAVPVAGGDTTVRELTGPTVRPWLRGIADRAGRPDLVPRSGDGRA